MGLVAAKCTQCGANIEVDESKEAGICAHCGTAFITEKVINNYTIHNHNTVNNNIAHATINVKKGDDIDDYVKRYRALVKQKKFRSAVKLLDKVGDKFPDSGLAYLCEADLLMSLPGYDVWIDPSQQEYKEEVLDDGSRALDMSFFGSADGGGYSVREINETIDLFDSKNDDEIISNYRNYRKRNPEKSISEGRFLRLILEATFPDKIDDLYGYLDVYEIGKKRDGHGESEPSGFDGILNVAKKSISTAEDLLTDFEREAYADFIKEVSEKYADFSKANERKKTAMKRLSSLADTINKQDYATKRKKKVVRVVVRLAIFAIVVVAAVIIVKKFI